MSTNADDSDGNTRAPRRSSRRLASTDSLTDLETRVVTPVIPARSKLDSISENVTTPSKQGRAIIDTPRVPRNQPAVSASPYRRTTRAMSQERDITASPLTTTRSKRRSVIADSDDDDRQSVDNSTPVVLGTRKKRQSMIPTPKVDLIEEEEEDVGSNDKTLVDELELRTRSISKSPSVHGSPPKASSVKSPLNGSAISKVEANESGFGVLDVSVVSQKKSTIFKSRDKKFSESESALSGEDIREHMQDPSPIKKYSSKKRQTLQLTKTDYMEVVERLTKSAEQPRSEDKTSRVKSSENSPKQDDEIVESSQQQVSLIDTPIRGRRSIRDGGSSNEDVIVEKLLVDFEDAPKTPISAKKSSQSVDKTPVSIKKTPKSPVKVNSAQATPESVKTPKGNATPVQAAMSPQSVKKTPKREARKSIHVSTEMDITNQIANDDMEITLNGNPNVKESTIRSPLPMQLSTPATKKPSLAALVDKMSDASPNYNRGRKSTSDINATSEVNKSRRSWSQPIHNVSYVSIDQHAVPEKEVIKAPNVLQKKRISDDESDDSHEKNSFVDEEADVCSDDSISESEREYLKQNEVADDGESLGSQDSNELAETSEEDENDSFIAEEDIQNEYDMNSEEERIENSPPKRRRSRIIAPSSSEDEEEAAPTEMLPEEETDAEDSKTDEVQEATPVKGKTPKKSLTSVETEQVTIESAAMEVADENLVSSATESKKSKRKRESYLHERENVNSKRARIDESVADKADDEASAPPTKKKAKSKNNPAESAVDIESVLSKCDQLMDAHNAEKKAKIALKREKKARKLALKQQQEALNKTEPMDSTLSSSNSNKENTLKKKKKPKHPKQKSVDDAQEPKEDMATSVLKAQEKAEEKRKIKRAKKLLKKQQGSESQFNMEANLQAGTSTVAVAGKAKKTKPTLDSSPESPKTLERIVQQDKVLEPEVETKKKKKKTLEESAEVIVEPPNETKRAKKRKIREVIEHEDEEKPQPKKLSILQQIEDKDNFNHGRAPIREANKNDRQKEQSFPMPLASQKLKKIIPESVEVAKRKKKNKSGNKVVPEPIISPPKPVWTSSGIFMEEPKTPYKFTSTQYVPIKDGPSSTKFGVVVFDAKKSKKAAQPIQDFRTQSMLRNKKRDGSMKNMRGLLGQRNTY